MFSYLGLESILRPCVSRLVWASHSTQWSASSSYPLRRPIYWDFPFLPFPNYRFCFVHPSLLLILFWFPLPFAVPDLIPDCPLDSAFCCTWPGMDFDTSIRFTLGFMPSILFLTRPGILFLLCISFFHFLAPDFNYSETWVILICLFLGLSVHISLLRFQYFGCRILISPFKCQANYPFLDSTSARLTIRSWIWPQLDLWRTVSLWKLVLQ